MLGLSKRENGEKTDLPGRVSRNSSCSRNFSVSNLLRGCSQEKAVRVREAVKGRGRK